MTLLRPNRTQSMSVHDASHVLGGLASVIGVILVVNSAWSSKPAPGGP